MANVSPPHRGQLLRDYTLTKSDGSTFMLSDFRGKLNLVLFFFPTWENTHAHLLRQLAEKFGEVRENETRLVVVIPREQLEPVHRIAGDSMVAAEMSAEAWAEVGAESQAAIYFTDKFREVFHVYRIPPSQPLPTADDILGWIRFVAMQCPECHPPEWPADALE